MIYQKNFNDWNEEKQTIQKTKTPNVYPKMRHIYYAKLGINIGFETDGKKKYLRPVLILAKIGSLYWVAPLTSQLKIDLFHHLLKSVTFENVKNSLVMLSQGRILDKKRIKERIGDMVSQEEFSEIQKKMKKLYFPSS